MLQHSIFETLIKLEFQALELKEYISISLFQILKFWVNLRNLIYFCYLYIKWQLSSTNYFTL